MGCFWTKKNNVREANCSDDCVELPLCWDRVETPPVGEVYPSRLEAIDVYVDNENYKKVLVKITSNGPETIYESPISGPGALYNYPFLSISEDGSTSTFVCKNTWVTKYHAYRVRDGVITQLFESPDYDETNYYAYGGFAASKDGAHFVYCECRVDTYSCTYYLDGAPVFSNIYNNGNGNYDLYNLVSTVVSNLGDVFTTGLVNNQSNCALHKNGALIYSLPTAEEGQPPLVLWLKGVSASGLILAGILEQNTWM